MKTVTIERLGHQGDGVASGPIFVAGTLPGEVVSGELSGDRLLAPRIDTPSSDRVRPVCPHARTCGGCQLQHASDDFVASWKAGIVRQALAAQGISAEIESVFTSPPNSRRRAVLSARRTKKGALVGFHAKASDVIVDVPNCQLLTPTLSKILPALAGLTVMGGSRKVELSLTITESPAGIDVLVVGGKPVDAMLRMELARFATAHGIIRLTWESDVIFQETPPIQRFGPVVVTPPPGAFLQATEHGQESLISAVLETVIGAKHVVDLFAGCGTFTLPTAQAAEVHAVEGSREMMQALDAGWRQAQGLKRVTTGARDLFRRPLMVDELNSFDTAIIDPPRAGAQAQVAELARSKIDTIAMVSCNPVTFARDVRHLTDAGFQLGSIRVVDQFRWSSHVEVVAALQR